MTNAAMAESRPDLWPLPARGAPVSPVWASPEFEAELAAWCRSVLDREVRLEVKKLRCWGAVWRVLTDDGTYYAKQNCPGQAFEAALMKTLARLTQRVVPVTAVDVDRGFLMTPDQGPVFADTVGDELEPWWARCLPNLTDAEMDEFGDAATYWLLALATPPLLTAERITPRARARPRCSRPSG